MCFSHQISLKDIVYVPSDKKLNLIFEYIDYDFKKYMNEHKETITPMQIKVTQTI